MTSKGYLKNLIPQNYRGKNLEIKFSLAFNIDVSNCVMAGIGKLQK